MKKSLLSIGIATLLFVGCVPARKYEDLKAKSEQCQKELAKFQTENEQFKTENTELSQMEDLEFHNPVVLVASSLLIHLR